MRSCYKQSTIVIMNGTAVIRERAQERSTVVTEPVFQVPAKKYGGESSVVSLRIPREMLKEIDEVAVKTGRTRNEILTMSLEFALEHMQIEE